MFRAIWPTIIPGASFNMHVSNYGLHQTFRARDIINASRELDKYLELVGTS